MGGRDNGRPFAEKLLVPQTPTADVADMALLRKRAPEAHPEPQSIAEIESALADLDRQRLELRASLARMETAEQELLAANAPDDAFDALDADRHKAKRALDRLDLRERKLVTMARDLADIESRARLADFVARYRSAVERCMDAYWAAAATRLDLAELRGEAARIGLEKFMPSLPIPHPALAMVPSSLNHFASSAMQELASITPASTQTPETFTIRFKARGMTRLFGRLASGYEAGDTASFSASEALQFVESGTAEWVGRPATAKDIKP